MRNIAVKEATKTEAREMTVAVRKKGKQVERDWWDLAQMINQCIKRRVPLALGMSSTMWMRKVLPHSIQKAWRLVRIARALEKVPVEKLREMPEGNAYALTRLPPKRRQEPEVIERAITTPTEKFRAEVHHEIVKTTGLKYEELRTIHQVVAKSIYDSFEQAIEKIARICDIDLLGYPERRPMCFERMAELVNSISEEALQNATEGGEPQMVEVRE